MRHARRSAVAPLVFLSHSSELGRYPTSRSFVAAAEAAVKRPGDAVVGMDCFPASDLPPAALCRERVLTADVCVLIVGLARSGGSYGSGAGRRQARAQS